MKKIIIILSILGFGGIVFGAPYLIYQRSLIPIDSTENLGTTTAKWDRLFVNFASTTSLTIDGTASTTNLVISGTCTGCTSGLTSLNGLTGGTQTFSSNSLLTITSSGTDHRFVASSSPGFGALNASSTITFNNLSNGAVSVSGGVLQGGTLSVGNGGTGQTSWTQGDVLFADSTSSLTGTSTVNLKNTLKLNLVENTALSTWAGSSNLVTAGNLIASSFISNASSTFADFLNVTGLLNASSTIVTTGNGIRFVNYATATIPSDATSTYAFSFATSTTANPLLRFDTRGVAGIATTSFKSIIEVSEGSASSTFANGINLTKGCFAVNGNCVSRFTGSGSAGLPAIWTSGTDLTSTTSLSASVGGTGWPTIAANSVLLGNGNARLATTSAGTNGQVLALVGGVPTWVATSTISDLSGISWNAGEVIYASGATTLIGTTTANLKTTLALNLVENTALSTWAGTSNITTLGTIGTGSWNATAIGNTKGGTGQNSSSWTGFAGIAGGTWSASSTLSTNFIQDAYLLNTGDVGTGAYDFGGGTTFEIPNGASPTLNTTGQITLDTTSGQLKWFNAGTGAQIITGTSSPSFSIGSTTPDAFRNNYGTATSTFLIKNDPEAFTLTGFYCKATSTAATSNIGLIRFGDGVNWTKTGTCNTTGAFTLTTSNNTFTRFEDFILEASSTAGKIDRLTITTIIKKTAD